jgi:hypothetical protein
MFILPFLSFPFSILNLDRDGVAEAIANAGSLVVQNIGPSVNFIVVETPQDDSEIGR